MFDSIWININAATMNDGYGIINNAAIGIKDGKIAFIGPEKDLPGKIDELTDYIHNGEGRWVTPGLIDCQTQLVYADNVAATEDAVYEQTLSRLRIFFHEGVMTFGINGKEEKMLRVAERLRNDLGLRLQTADARAGTPAIVLPAAFYFRHDTQPPPVDLFRKNSTPIAVASGHDATTPVLSLLLMLNMACVMCSLTPEEALAGVTRHAAQALGLQNIIGTLEKGKTADIAVWNIAHPRDLCYFLGGNPCYGVVMGGNFYNFEVE